MNIVAVSRPRVKPTRKSPRPDRPFGEGLDEPKPAPAPESDDAPKYEPLPDSRLTDAEARRVTAAYWRGFTNFENRHPGIEHSFCEGHGEAAAMAMRLKIAEERAVSAAKAEAAKAAPKPARRSYVDDADREWYLHNTPTRHYGFTVVGQPRRWDRLAGESLAQSRHEDGMPW